MFWRQDVPTFASWILGWKVCTTTPGSSPFVHLFVRSFIQATHRLISKEDVNIRHDFHQGSLEELANERCRQIQSEDLVLLSGILSHFQYWLWGHCKKKALGKEKKEEKMRTDTFRVSLGENKWNLQKYQCLYKFKVLGRKRLYLTRKKFSCECYMFYIRRYREETLLISYYICAPPKNFWILWKKNTPEVHLNLRNTKGGRSNPSSVL